MGADTRVTWPFRMLVEAERGLLGPGTSHVTRHESDLRGHYQSPAAHNGDALVYSVTAAPVPEVGGELPFSLTTIEPGLVGEEFYMTKGHIHSNLEAEIYLTTLGRGVLLLFDGAQVTWVEMAPGVAAYVPAGWAHRTVNVSLSGPLRFLAFFPGLAGHDYHWVEEHGMGARVVRSPAGYEVVAHPGVRLAVPSLPPEAALQARDALPG